MNRVLEKMRKLAPLLKLWVTRDWEAKLVSLVLAFLLWYVVRDQVARATMPLRENWPQMRTVDL
jgi:hypothetical protein